jgi:hypothetical protein
MTAITDQLAQALQRLARNFDLLLAGKAVRDVSETQAEVTAALAAYDAAPDDDAKDAAPNPAYSMCESGFGTFRVILGYDTLKEAQAAHAAFAHAARSKP